MGRDYGTTHMEASIIFFYQHGNIHCMNENDAPGLRVKALRLQKKLTQVQLAELVGIDQSTLSDIERGGGLYANTLMSLCDALDTSPQFIMRGRELNHADLLAQIKALVQAESAVKQREDKQNNSGIPPATVQTNPPILARHVSKEASQLPDIVQAAMTSKKGVSRESDKSARKKKPRGGGIS